MDKKQSKTRKTLLQLQAETKVRDPAVHAKNQVRELDKTAKRTLSKRRQCSEQIETDKKELQHVEEQLNLLRSRYNTLCSHLNNAIGKRKLVIQTLESCVKEEKQIMGVTQGIVQCRMIEDSKLARTMATNEIQSQRGFSLGPESTYHQKKAP